MTVTTCQVCGCPAQLFLCPSCTGDLRDTLTALASGGQRPITIVTESGKILYREETMPGMLEYLAQAANGQARLGNTSARKTGGDESPLRYNPRAAALHQECFEALRMWARHIARINQHVLTWRTSIGYATYLANNTDLLAKDEDAGEAHKRFNTLARRIEHTINRPIPPKLIGPCPTFDENGNRCSIRQPNNRKTRVALYARRDATHVVCPQCKKRHDVRDVEQKAIIDREKLRFDASEILNLMASINEPLSERTWRDWRAKGRIKIRGYRRPDGSKGLTRHNDDDEPLYRLADVRRLRAKQPKRKARTE